MKVVEKLGTFYLGRTAETQEALLYESKDLTTHAVCVGMTGSGKTGLGIAMLEEAALDRIPAIIIDPKGDLGDLLLTFPHLSKEEFLPWVDAAEAERNGMSVPDYAESVATTWREGLESWGEGVERIQEFRQATEMVIYTPGSRAGVPLSILSSFAAPSKEFMLDAEAVRDRLMSTTSSLLGLIGINADPIKSREHILISTILDQAWRKGLNLDLVSLIQQVQKPPFNKIGALDVETFFPAKERVALSVSLNNLLASPGFQTWMEGEPLDIQRLLYTQEGKPKLAIISIAHLSNAERMFFVTLLLNEFLSWMRRQPGTSSLRALLYMDEIFGFFPPIAVPPSKIPMLTLLKQARAYGVGIMLATQNPVDLDYKGLSNCGTWFIGKLQTERDRGRVLEGLNIASNGEMDSGSLKKLLSATGKRMFIMQSVHEPAPILFQTRWTMSYLKGPLTLAQISVLTASFKQDEGAQEVAKENISGSTGLATSSKPILSEGIEEFFVRQHPGDTNAYKPFLLGMAKLHFVDAKKRVDEWETICRVVACQEAAGLPWERSVSKPDLPNQLLSDVGQNSTFEELSAEFMNVKNYSGFEKSLAAYLYQSETLVLYHAAEMNLLSKVGETEGDFRSRIAITLRENRDEALKKVQNKYADKIENVKIKLRRAQDKVVVRQEKAGWQKIETAISFFTTLIGALFGRGVTKGTINQAGTTVRRAGRITRGGQEVTQAEEDSKAYQEQLDDLTAQMNAEVAKLGMSLDPSTVGLEEVIIRPRKSDITVEKVGILWA
ncbi:MAG: ATP-binding protein [Parachlamydiaceae bacterium]|nr:ATP-binding protein [Parachlamydiaceae bacterium]